jgi:hypothetical protein
LIALVLSDCVELRKKAGKKERKKKERKKDRKTDSRKRRRRLIYVLTDTCSRKLR